jgi:hypothetical protein
MSYVKELEKAEKRIEKYWSKDEIDVDLANEIVEDCGKLVNEVRELRALLQASQKTTTEYMMFQNIVEGNMSQHDFYKLLGQWQQKLSENRGVGLDDIIKR